MSSLEREAIPGREHLGKKEFLGLREELTKLMDELDDAEGADANKKRAERREIVRNFLRELQGRRNCFRLSFKTEQGSIYFVSHEGMSWRFKREKDGSYRDQPLMKKIIFVSKAEKDRMLRILRSPDSGREIVGCVIEKSEISEGVFPVELWMDGFPEVIFEETPHTLNILGSEMNGYREKSFASGIHIGHEVVDIL